MFDMDCKGIYFYKRMYLIKHYILFSSLTNVKFKEAFKNVKGTYNKILFTILYIPGIIATKIKFK